MIGIAGAGEQPLKTLAGRPAIVFSAFAILLLWPTVLDGSPLMFFDSGAYYSTGAKAVKAIFALLSAGPGGGSEADGALASDGAFSLRSIAYPVFAYVTSLTPIGLWGPVLVQSAVVTWLIFLLIGPAGRQAMGAGTDPLAALRVFGPVLAVIALASSLPWFASYFMPDVFAGVVVMVGLVIAYRGSELKLWEASFLVLIGAMAVASHHSHIPLALVVGLFAAGALIVDQRRLPPVPLAAAALPLVLALGFNMAVSMIAFNTPSATPKRLPVLLARSIEDGPARWYLSEHCADRKFTICEIYDEFPQNAASVLFGEGGLRSRATDRQMDQIRAQEIDLLVEVLKTYPLQQAWSFGRNALSQLFSFGTNDFRWSRIRLERDPPKLWLVDYFDSPDRFFLDLMGVVHYLTVIASLGFFVYLFRKDRLLAGRRNWYLLLVAFAGIGINALVCGGLSAPTDRYQARLIWVLPVLAGLFWLERRSAPKARAPAVELQG
ncbi:MAG: hypothetical protein HXY25_11710 [Alphaproteobacteria bacterium]|nr:hypothetical protein [Alphaproteobacteria bacterium]